MTTIRRIICTILTIGMLLTCCACSANAASEETETKYNELVSRLSYAQQIIKCADALGLETDNQIRLCAEEIVNDT